MHDFALINGVVATSGLGTRRMNIGVIDGKIATLTDGAVEAEEILDADGLTVIPGLIDEHVHGFLGYDWETYQGMTRAAAKGGVTTIVDMPFDKPPTLSARALIEKLAAIKSECYIDYAAFGGYLEDDPDEMAAMASAGVVAYKLFPEGLTPPDIVFPGVRAGQTLDVMRRARKEDLTVVVHCEDTSIVELETRRLKAEGRTDPGAWDEARPWFSELAAVQQVSFLAEITGCRTVIAHTPSPQSVVHVRDARVRGADVWIETCPHYLCLTKEQMAADSRLKWNPPSRDAASVEELWLLLKEGHIHTIATDHAPLPKLVDADIWDQAPGVGNGLEVMLSVIGTEALHRRDVPLTQLVDLVSTTPARLFGMFPAKGTISVGSDADFAVVETSGRREIDARNLEYHDQEAWSPFDGWEVRVYPVYTIVRGRIIYAEGDVVGVPGYGEFVTKHVVAAV
jgi:allantoinase